MPRMSLGIRSGVNCTRRNCRLRICPRALIMAVLPTPGRPSSRMWPRLNMPANTIRCSSCRPSSTRSSSASTPLAKSTVGLRSSGVKSTGVGVGLVMGNEGGRMEVEG